MHSGGIMPLFFCNVKRYLIRFFKFISAAALHTSNHASILPP